MWQEYRDKMAFAFESADNEADRYTQMAIATMGADADIEEAKLALKAGNQKAAGGFVEKVFGGVVERGVNKAVDYIGSLFP